MTYGDSDTDPGGPSELTVGTDSNPTNGHLDWSSYPGDPLVIDEDWTLVTPSNNNVSLSVMGTTITHATGGGVDIKNVSLYVGANPGLKVWLTDITATFSKSSGCAIQHTGRHRPGRGCAQQQFEPNGFFGHYAPFIAVPGVLHRCDGGGHTSHA